MIPVIAIVGRPNVGKSTLFNCLTKTRDALVADVPGVTRDRKYGEGRMGDREYIVIDTGGLGGEEDDIGSRMATQSKQAMLEADVILFMVDGAAGLTPMDEGIADQLRQIHKAITLVVNKTDGIDTDVALADFFGLGLGEPVPIAASHRRGVSGLIDGVLATFSTEAVDEEDIAVGIKLAIVGRPNVGKSTLINRLLGEERVIVCDRPGTTRDSILIPFERRGKRYTLIDTAGVRKRGKVHDVVEKFSVIKTLQAIEQSHVVVLMIDARENIAEQDLRLLGFILDAGKALVIAINKWDGLETEQREKVKSELDRRLRFVDFAETHFISALHGSGVGKIFEFVNVAHRSATKKLSTPALTRLLEKAVAAHPPPAVFGRRIKLRYAHQGGQNPPVIVVHGNQTDKLSNDYRRYLANTFRKALALKGTPVRIVFKSGGNPFH